MAAGLEKLIFQIEANTAQLRSELAKASSAGAKTGRKISKGFEKLGRTLDKVKRSVFSVRGALIGLGAGLVLRSMIKSIAQFESSMSGLRAVTNAAAVDMKNMEDVALQLGATTAFSSTEAAAGMEFLGRAGFTTDQIMQSIGATLDLAAAGSLDLARAADIASNVLTGFRLEAAEMARVTDIMGAAASSSNTSVEQMGDALKFAAPVASSFGVSIETSAAAVGVLSNAGLQATLAGTGLRRVMAELASPSKDLEKAMGGLSLETDGLVAVLEKVSKSSFGATDALVVFGQRGGPAFNVLTAGIDKLKQLDEEFLDVEGVVKRMAEQRLDNLAGSFVKLQSVIDGLTQSLGKRGLSGFLRTTIDFWKEFLAVILDVENILNRINENTLKGRLSLIGTAIDEAQGRLDKLNSFKDSGLDNSGLEAARLSVIKEIKKLREQELKLIKAIADQTVKAFKADKKIKDAAKDAPKLGALNKGLLEDFDDFVGKNQSPLRELESTFKNLGLVLAEKIEEGLREGSDITAVVQTIADQANAAQAKFDKKGDFTQNFDISPEGLRKGREALQLVKDIKKAESFGNFRPSTGRLGDIDASTRAGNFKNRISIDKQIEGIDAQLLTIKNTAENEFAPGFIQAIQSMGKFGDAFDGLKIRLTEGEAGESLASPFQELNEAMRKLQSAQDSARVIQDVKTASEEWADTIVHLNKLQDDFKISNGEVGISLETMNLAIAKADKTLKESKTGFKEAQDNARNFAQAIGTAFEDAILQGQGLREVMKGLLDDIARIILRISITKPLEGILGGFVGGLFNANGNAFSSSGVVPFAKGGIVNSPTVFPFAGGTGLMGEAGPEAILPLSRDGSGRLGVKSQGGGGRTTINIDVTGARGNQEIQEMVASGIERASPFIIQSAVSEVNDEQIRNF